MTASGVSKRIIVEIEKLRALAENNDPSSVKFLLDQSPVNNPGTNIILGRICPQSEIYNQAAFQIELKLPAEYPHKAPGVRFTTPIYHPNVSDDGKVCIEMFGSSGSYKPTTTLVDIVNAVVDRIDKPDSDHVLNQDIATEYLSNRAVFDQKASEMVKKHGLPRH
ncbi:unnamed protein product [Rotaria sp. Silwood1]|nr:unnamed protein product [Rotaria sp. Silwood1]